MRALIASIVLAVLAPTGAVLWFMNEATRSQAESARQSVREAYRGQLRLLRDKVDAMWGMRAEAMDKALNLPSALRSSGADSAILFDQRGAVIYPVPVKTIVADTLVERPDWTAAQMIESRRDRPAEAATAYAQIARTEKDASIAARAVQAQVRCLLAAGRKSEALATIQRRFGAGRLARALDLQGRWIAADEQLLALKLQRNSDSPLHTWLAAYSESMPTAQRLFLIAEARSMAPGLGPFLYEDADRLALEYVEAERPRPGAVAVEPSGLRGIWKLTSTNAQRIALYRTQTIVQATLRELGPVRDGVFAVFPPGARAAPDAIAAGPAMPGWQMSVAVANSRLNANLEGRVSQYLAVGYTVVAALVLIGLFVGQSFAKQLKLARLKTDLVAAVSHELKTPLASMRLLVDSLLEDGVPDPKKTSEYLQLISGENLRLTRLIENFLTFSRIERNRQRFEMAPTSPARVVESAMAAMRERWPDCPVEVEVAPDLPRIQADEDALVTVLLNLLDNAYKYTPQEKRIALRALADGNGVSFVAQDNGIGIAPREQKKIFRRFYQVDTRLARETGGCGLGLSIVDYIVRAHGGRVDVKSAEGAGSTFRVWLPVEAKS